VLKRDDGFENKTTTKLHPGPTNFSQSIEPTAERVRPAAKYLVK